MLGNLTENGARLKRVFIQPKLPASLEPLNELAHNLWWSWNFEAIELFDSVAPGRMEALNYNPIAMLEELPTDRADQLANDLHFLDRMRKVHKAFLDYMGQKAESNQPHVAYFCMEYGLHQSLRLYSGGLGVLAGDYLKEASDTNTKMTAVGLLYRYGYFQQEISLHGEQIHHLDPVSFTQLPLSPVRDAQGEWIKIHINLAGRTVWAKAWLLKVGRINLYLLDTDFDDNRWEDRSITHQLYGGDSENRLRQELLLGVGGYRLIQALGLHPEVFHLNEGHASFLSLERLSHYVKNENLSYEEALEVVRGTQLFTTHTPVPAGHDTFSESLLRDYIFKYTHRLNLPWQSLMSLGRRNADDEQELFNVTLLAIRTSQEVNGVSKLHGEVSRKMFSDIYPDYGHTESHIGYVTNSVHFPTWIAKEWLEYYVDLFGKQFLKNNADPANWEKILHAPASDILAIRQKLKTRLLDWVKRSLTQDMSRRGANPRNIFEIVNNIQDNALLIGFARRFATYKRATLLFSNEERLAEILNNASRPVIFLFAGKAHPADKAGQEFIRLIYQTTQNPRFKGKVIFLENYGMEMAKLLVQGVDIWLNTPTRPKEASGTSGMKAVLNGVMNFSVLDGWWCEGFQPGAGWALPEKETYQDANLQNELDAETLYNILEYDVIPTYYGRNEQGVSEAWVSHIKNTIAYIAPKFVMKRMLDDYKTQYYQPLWIRGRKLRADKFERAKQLAAWKLRMIKAWPGIEALEIKTIDVENDSLEIGGKFNAEVTLKAPNLHPSDIGVEIVFFRRHSETELELLYKYDMQDKGGKNGAFHYVANIPLQQAGVFEFGFRVYPKHEMLPHRQALNLVRWL